MRSRDSATVSLHLRSDPFEGSSAFGVPFECLGRDLESDRRAGRYDMELFTIEELQVQLTSQSDVLSLSFNAASAIY